MSANSSRGFWKGAEERTDSSKTHERRRTRPHVTEPDSVRVQKSVNPGADNGRGDTGHLGEGRLVLACQGSHKLRNRVDGKAGPDRGFGDVGGDLVGGFGEKRVVWGRLRVSKAAWR